MATLYTQADSNIRKTWLLMSVMVILVIGLSWIFSYLLKDRAIFLIGIPISILISFSSYWFSDQLVLSMSGAQLIEKKDNPELYRIVENLCITAGLSVPKIYILNESQPNAFATGRNAQNAVIAVTSGLLEKLDQAELEGVIAHELSHIGNKDMVLATVIVVMAGVISMLSNQFLRISRWQSRNRDRDNSSSIVFFAFAILAAILAPIAATLIRLSISRKREFLADASGALLTRYPDGLIRALEKISDDSTPLRVANNATAHLYISNPFKDQQTDSWFVKLFMTHPPIEERVSALKEIKI